MPGHITSDGSNTRICSTIKKQCTSFNLTVLTAEYHSNFRMIGNNISTNNSNTSTSFQHHQTSQMTILTSEHCSDTRMPMCHISSDSSNTRISTCCIKSDDCSSIRARISVRSDFKQFHFLMNLSPPTSKLAINKLQRSQASSSCL